jgi:hypothetical protein
MARIIIKNARLAFPDVFKATQYQNQGPWQYRSTFLIAPDNPCKAEIDAAIKEVAKAKWGAKADVLLPEILIDKKACCFIDGNRRTYNGYAGNWARTATRNQDDGRPAVVDRGKNPLSAEDGKIYSGAWVNGIVEIWAQSNSYGNAIRATLVTVQFVKDGDSFGGAAPASAEGLDDLGADFDDEDDLL